MPRSWVVTPGSANPGAAIERSRAFLRITGGHCAAVADRIYDDVIQELSALSLSLGAESDHDDLTDGERDALRTRTRAIQQCSRLLGAVAERLMDLDFPPEAVAP